MTLRSAALALVIAAAALSPAVALLSTASPARAQAQRDAEAEAFVSNEASQALTILNRSGSTAQKKAEFRAFVDRVADVPVITRFVLGRYARTLSPQQYSEFAQAFRLYANSVYESRLGQYHGETLRVTGSVVRKPGDVVVNSQVVGGQVRQPVDVKWRVLRGADGHYRAVDVSIEGVWLAITEQQDFVSTLDNHRGDVNVLVSQLRSQTEQENSGRR